MIKAQKINPEILRTALKEFLEKNNKTGKMKFSQLAAQSGGKFDSIEITDSNIKDFLETARKYDIDYALKRDNYTTPQTYHVFFTTKQTENFKKAFAEYAYGKSAQLTGQEKAEVKVEQLKKIAKTVSQEKNTDRERTRKRENNMSM